MGICDAENGAGTITQSVRLEIEPHSIRQPRQQLTRVYFSEVLIVVKEALRVVPILLTLAMMARLMPAAISPYSIAVAPASSARNFKNVFFKAALLGHTIPEILSRFHKLNLDGKNLKLSEILRLNIH